ncbi:hypothetical protein [Chitinophaga sp. CF418]|uniref:head-tail joining protein n=1 Tax=Chitinophaga sp. CF418 TaxID=1855287 RepID=UPI00122C8668|nr:hypothetical protein [Chitinophaga sp. CF418]
MRTAFDVVTTAMGCTATWIPSLGAEPVTAEVLYKDPTEGQPLIDTQFEIEGCTMEYKKGDLPGLREAVNSSALPLQIITITHQDGSVFEYWVKSYISEYDGQTLVAKIVQR